MTPMLPFPGGLPQHITASKRRRRRRVPFIVVLPPAVNRFAVHLNLSVRREWPNGGPFSALWELLSRVLTHWICKLLVLWVATLWSTTTPVADATYRGRAIGPWLTVIR